MTNPALPFGTYTVCVESRTPGSTSTTRWKDAHQRQELVPQGHQAAEIRRQSGDRHVHAARAAPPQGRLRMSRLRSEAGFTLPELLVAMSSA